MTKEELEKKLNEASKIYGEDFDKKVEKYAKDVTGSMGFNEHIGIINGTHIPTVDDITEMVDRERKLAEQEAQEEYERRYGRLPEDLRMAMAENHRN